MKRFIIIPWAVWSSSSSSRYLFINASASSSSSSADPTTNNISMEQPDDLASSSSDTGTACIPSTCDCSEIERTASIYESLFEKCTLTQQNLSQTLEFCNQELRLLSNETIPNLEEEIKIGNTIQNRLQNQFNEKVVELSSSQKVLEVALLNITQLTSERDEVFDKYNEAASNVTSIQRSYDALQKFSRNETKEYKRQIHALKLKNEQWREMYEKANDKNKETERKNFELEKELSILSDVDDPYCNLTLIRADIMEITMIYSKIAKDEASRLFLLLHNRISMYANKTFLLANSFIKREVVPFVQRLEHELRPTLNHVVHKVQDIYSLHVYPHVVYVYESISDLYVEHVKDHVDRHIIPKYEDFVAPAVNILMDNGIMWVKMIKPKLWSASISFKNFAVACRLSMKSSIEELSKSSLAYLRLLEKEKNIVTPTCVLNLLFLLESEADFIVDFVFFIVASMTIFHVVLYILLIPFRLVSRLLYSSNKKMIRKKAKKSKVKNEEMSPPRSSTYSRNTTETPRLKVTNVLSGGPRIKIEQ